MEPAAAAVGEEATSAASGVPGAQHVRARRRCRVYDINEHLLCALCSGYLVDATAIIECLHTFCRSCIVRYLESSQTCPVCDVPLHENSPLLGIRPDSTLQSLVYKLVPGVYREELRRRAAFFSNPPQGSRSITQDVLLKDITESSLGRKIYSGTEQFSICLEYSASGPSVPGTSSSTTAKAEAGRPVNRRYLLCPAALTIRHLKKLISSKLDVTPEYQLTLFHSDEILDDDYSLMDVAYITAWNALTPLQFYYSLQTESQRAAAAAAAAVVQETAEERSTLSSCHRSDVQASRGPLTSQYWKRRRSLASVDSKTGDGETASSKLEKRKQASLKTVRRQGLAKTRRRDTGESTTTKVCKDVPGQPVGRDDEQKCDSGSTTGELGETETERTVAAEKDCCGNNDKTSCSSQAVGSALHNVVQYTTTPECPDDEGYREFKESAMSTPGAVSKLKIFKCSESKKLCVRSADVPEQPNERSPTLAAAVPKLCVPKNLVRRLGSPVGDDKRDRRRRRRRRRDHVETVLDPKTIVDRSTTVKDVDDALSSVPSVPEATEDEAADRPSPTDPVAKQQGASSPLSSSDNVVSSSTSSRLLPDDDDDDDVDAAGRVVSRSRPRRMPVDDEDGGDEGKSVDQAAAGGVMDGTGDSATTLRVPIRLGGQSGQTGELLLRLPQNVSVQCSFRADQILIASSPATTSTEQSTVSTDAGVARTSTSDAELLASQQHTITTPCSVQSDGEVAEINRVKPQSATSNVGEPEVVTSVDSDHETGVSDDVASTQRESAVDVDDSNEQPDISMFPFVTVSPCRRKATPPTQRQSELGHSDDRLLHCHADNVRSSPPPPTSTVTSSACSGWMSPSPTVSSTWMSPARVTSCTSGPDAPSPGSSSLGSPKDHGRTPPSSPGGLAGLARGDVPQSPDTGVVVGASSPATSTPAPGPRVNVIKVPVYSPVYRDPAAPHRRHTARPASPRRCSVVISHTDVLDLSPSRKSQQHSRPGNNSRRAITFSENQRDRQPVVCPTADAASVPRRSPDKQTTKSLVGPWDVGGSLNRKLSVSTNSPPRDGGSESRLSTTPVVVCERHEADSASLSPSKPVQPTSIQSTTTTAATLFVAAAAAAVPPATSASTKDSVVSACTSQLVVNLQRCDSAPTSVALPGRPIGGGKRRRAVGSGLPSTHKDFAAPSKRRRLKLMCNGMTIYRDIDDVAASAPARVRTARRRASLPTFPVESPSNSVVKRRHMSTDDVTSASRDQTPLPPPSVEVMSSEVDSGLTKWTTASDGDSGIGPLDYSTDRSTIDTVPTNVTVPSSVPDSSLTFDEPLELTTAQVRERQKSVNDCGQPQIANQFAVC